MKEKKFDVHYEEFILKHKFDADFVFYDNIILEAKATTFIHWDNFRQTLNYLKASQNIELGIIINFGTDKLESRRIVLTQGKK